MYETLLAAMNEMFKNKPMLTVKDVREFLDCSEESITNWSKRADSHRRPPRIFVGKEVRFPKRDFAKWLADEQTSFRR